MLFNSYGFLFLFLRVVLAEFFCWHSMATGWLTPSSLLFYGYWNPAYVLLLLASVGCNYTFGLSISKTGDRSDPGARKTPLVLAVTANLLLLAYYRYASFFLGNLGELPEFA